MTKEFSQPQDIEKLLRLLFLERKRVKDLNVKVQELDGARDRLEHQIREVEQPPMQDDGKNLQHILDDERRITEKLKRLVIAQRTRIQELESSDTAERHQVEEKIASLQEAVIRANEGAKELHQLRQEHAQLQGQRMAASGLQETIDQLMTERHRFEEKIASLQEAIIRANEGARELHQLRLEQAQFQGQRTATQERIAELEGRYEQARLAARTAEQRLEESEQRREEMEALCTGMTSDQAEIVAQLEQTEVELAEIKNLYEGACRERTEGAEAQKDLRARLEQREEEALLLRKQVTEEMVHRAQVATERQRERAQFDRQLLESSHALGELQHRLSQMVDRGEAIQEQAFLSNRLAEAKASIEELERRIREEMVDRREVLESHSQLVLQLEAKCQALEQLQRRVTEEMVDKKEMSRLQEEFERLQMRFDLLHRERAEAMEREEQLQTALDLAEGEIEKANGEREAAHDAVHQVRIESTRLHQEHEQQAALFAQRLEAALQELACLKQELAENERLYTEIESHKESLELAHQSHLLEVQRLHDGHQEVIDHLGRQMAELDERLATAQYELSSKEQAETSLSVLRTEFAAQQDRGDQLRTQCEQLQQGCDATNKLLLEKEEILQKLQAQGRLLQEEQMTLRRQVREREHQLQTAQRHLAKKLKEYALLQQSSDQVKAQLIDQEKAISDYKSEMIEIGLEKALAEEKVRSAESRTRQAEAELQNWKRNHADLESEVVSLRKRASELEQVRDRYVRVDAEYRQMRQIFSSIQSSLGNVGSGAVVETYPVSELVAAEVRAGRAPSPPTIREDREIGQADLFGQSEEQPAGAVREDLFG